MTTTHSTIGGLTNSGFRDGHHAYHNGMERIPYLDPKVVETLQTTRGEATIAYLEAWNAGWVTANLADDSNLKTTGEAQ